MPDTQGRGLHLPDLEIKNFRGIRHLSIRQLGRVTLLAGLNGAGKTTILEAIRVYANRGHQDVFDELLRSRGEFVNARDENQELISIPDYTTLFFGRPSTPDRRISIGPGSGQDHLHIEVLKLNDLRPFQQELFDNIANGIDLRVLRVMYRNKETILPWLPSISDLPGSRSDFRAIRTLRRMRLGKQELPSPFNCESLGPGPPDDLSLARLWDNVVLTEYEALALQALGLTGEHINRVAVVGEDYARFHGTSRRIVVKVRDHRRRVPLRSLGDGIVRLFAAGLALAGSRDGFLIIDEVENGIHYSLEKAFWSMVLKAAQEFNVQVLATTHSFDCVKGFALAAIANRDVRGALIRLDRKNGVTSAVEYNEEELEVVSEQNIEVR